MGVVVVGTGGGAAGVVVGLMTAALDVEGGRSGRAGGIEKVDSVVDDTVTGRN